MEEVADKKVKELQKKFGDEVIQVGFQREIEWISTGVLDLNLATHPHSGTGGIPRGRIVEIYGKKGSGKSTIAYSTIGEAQKEGLKCTLFDAENAFNPGWAKMFGVDPDDMVFCYEQEGEMVLDIIEAMAYDGSYDLLVIDSVAALASRKELEDAMGDEHVGLHGKMWSKAMRKLKAPLAKSNTTLILINQLREDVGKMFGNPEIRPGGRAIGFYGDLVFNVKDNGEFSSGKGRERDVYGHQISVVVKKNKVGISRGIAHIDLYYRSGFDYTSDLLEAGKKTGVIETASGWRKYNPLAYVPEDENDYFITENGEKKFIAAVNDAENSELLKEEMRQRILLGDDIEPIYVAEGISDKEEKVVELGTEQDDGAEQQPA